MITALLLLLCASVFAQSITEVKHDPVPEPAPIQEIEEKDFDIQGILSLFLEQAADVEIPEGVTIPEDLDSEQAVQLILYVFGKYVNLDELMALIQGSIDNGEFDQ